MHTDKSAVPKKQVTIERIGSAAKRQCIMYQHR